jgi:hypothetical protein
MNKRLFYFGCIGKVGHYFWETNSWDVDSRNIRIEGVNTKIFRFLDGNFTPNDPTEGIYNDCVIPPLRIIAWHDYSVDKRPGSNSVLIGYGYETAEEMIDAAYKKFPSVMNRQPRPKPLIQQP